MKNHFDRPFDNPFEGFAVQKILDVTGGQWVNADQTGSAARSLRLKQISALGASSVYDVAFFFSKDYQEEVKTARPGVLITAAPFVKPLQDSPLPIWKQSVVVVCSDPYFAMALLSKEFARILSNEARLERPSESKIHPTAVIHPTAKIGRCVEIGAFSVIEENAEIGEGTVIYPHCYVGHRVHVGDDCVIFHGVTLYEETRVGNRVRIHAGTRIGVDGFGYAPIMKEKKVGGHQKIYHLGNVILEDDVEIGANSCIDRSTFGGTTISHQSKIDNQVHIGHNAFLGEGTIVCGNTCFAGGSSTGKFVYVGGLSALSNKVHIGDYALVGGATAVTKDAIEGGEYLGIPCRPAKEHFKVHALLNRLLDQRSKNKEK